MGLTNRLEDPRQAPDWVQATVMSCAGPTAVSVDTGLGVRWTDLSVATHVGMLVPGQRVLVAAGGCIEPLVVAAYPLARDLETEAAPSTPMVRYDAAQSVLTIEAVHLRLNAIGTVELRCGDAVIRLNAQGEVLTQAQSVTQAAVGPFRIEGASIDLN